jgi:hypothetical protein
MDELGRPTTELPERFGLVALVKSSTSLKSLSHPATTNKPTIKVIIFFFHFSNFKIQSV